MKHPLLASATNPFLALREDVLAKVGDSLRTRVLIAGHHSNRSSQQARQRALVEFGANIPELAPGDRCALSGIACVSPVPFGHASAL